MCKNKEDGKLIATSTVAGVDVPFASHRLCVIDMNTRERFLVDTGADISVLAARNKTQGHSTSAKYQLYAANNTPIRTYGERTLELNLGLRRRFRWTFVVADVKTSILGADFLRSQKLVVDLHRRKLLDQVTDIDIDAIEINNHDPAVYMVNRDHTYHDILMKYPDVLRPMSLKTPPKHSVTHHIETTGPPLFARPRPLPPDKYKAAKLEFEKMIDMGICRPSKSSWASPLHVVTKKDGSLRVCGDYRRLNAVTVPDRYPIPRIQDFTYRLHGKTIFSKLDIKTAYFWIPNRKEDTEKTAIITPFGLFEFSCMTFGLRNSGQTFQRFMHEVLRGLDDHAFCFVDDILVHSTNPETHRKHVEEVLERLSKFGISLNIDKCEFGKKKIQFLGYEVTTEGIKPTEDHIKAIRKYPKPETVQELRRFLGMVNFYRDCLPRQAENQYELNKYLHNCKKNDKTSIQWTPEAEKAFDKCRQSIIDATTLTHPVPNAPLCLLTDASDKSLGGVLQQKVNNIWKPLAFFSKSMSETQRRYSVYDRELLAMYTAVRHMRRLIEGNDITIYTDHKPLSYALTKPPTSGDTPRRERQLHYVSQFCSNIKYIDGSKNQAADALSRIDKIEEIQLSSSIDFEKLAEDQDTDEDLKMMRENHNLRFDNVIFSGVSKTIVCESSTGKIRPYLPTAYRYAAFKAQHDISHPGVRTTRKLMASKYFWPAMNKEVGNWTRACIGCQRAKVQRHVNSPIGEFPDSARFEQIHIDIVGPLPLSNEFRYLVTIIDRCTRWPEAIPVRDITAETVAKAVYEGWIARFGCPLRATTDRGLQFQSSLFTALMTKFGVSHIKTTAYHPSSNGKIERWHRTLKAALMARGVCTRWSDELPTVLLGLRTALCADTNFSPALMTYGSTLRVPSDIFVPAKTNIEDASFVRRLTETMASLVPKHRRATCKQTFVYKDLTTCDYVFVRNDTVRGALKPPYDGPYEILERHDKYFKLQLPLRTSNVSIDRLKPAYILNEDTERAEFKRTAIAPPSPPPCPHQPASSPVHAPPACKPESAKPYVTRSGRVVKKRVRFA